MVKMLEPQTPEPQTLEPRQPPRTSVPGSGGVSRSSLTLVVLFALGCGVVFGYTWATGGFAVDSKADALAGAHGVGTEAAKTAPSGVEARSTPLPNESSAHPPPNLVATGASTANGEGDARSSSGAADPVDKWIADTYSDDPQVRAAAITALSNAPKARALPTLQNVLDVGDPAVDRPLALRSLRSLAQSQGDADGKLREVLRHAIYHGDDDTTTRAAQVVLGEIENSGSRARLK